MIPLSTILRQVVQVANNREEIEVNRDTHDECDDWSENGEEKWGYCCVAECTESGHNPMQVYTFVWLDSDRYQLCPWCMRKLDEFMEWRSIVLVLLSRFLLPKDLRFLIIEKIIENE